MLPEYDLSHVDRARVHAGLGPGLTLPTGGRRVRLAAGRRLLRAFWQIVKEPGRAALTIDRFTPAPDDPPNLVEEIATEARGLLLSPDAGEHYVRFDPSP